MPDEYEGNGHGEPGQLADTVVEGLEIEALEKAEFPGGRQVVQRGVPDISSGMRQHSSVLQTYIQPIVKDDDYRSALNRANWMTVDEIDEWCNAFEECKRYGASTTWLIDRLIAHAAGVTGGKSLRNDILEAISHTTFNLNNNQQQQYKKKGLFSRNGRAPLTE